MYKLDWRQFEPSVQQRGDLGVAHGAGAVATVRAATGGDERPGSLSVSERRRALRPRSDWWGETMKLQVDRHGGVVLIVSVMSAYVSVRDGGRPFL